MIKKLAKKIIIAKLTFLAKMAIRRYKPKVIMVTGTVGKTSTKDAVFTAMSTIKNIKVRKSDKSFNSEIGVPLTILNLPNGWNNPFMWVYIIFTGSIRVLFTPSYPDWIVLEVGADEPGDIKKILSYVKPTVVVVSQLSSMPVHVENFPSPQSVIEEELSPIHSVQSHGIIIWNNDDVVAYLNVKPGDRSSLCFGFAEDSDVWASHEEILYKNGKPVGMNFRVDYAGSSVPVRILGSIGRSHVYPVLAGIAAAVSQGGNFVDIAGSYSSHQTPKGRMKIIEGLNNSTIIDDSYNSSPIALVNAIETIKSIKTNGRKIALLGDMLELGEFSEEEHRKCGSLAKYVFDINLSFGKRSVDFGFENHFDNAEKVGKYISSILKEGDIVLVKGSQGSGENKIRLERSIKYFMAEPERASELLVRQGKEWS